MPRRSSNLNVVLTLVALTLFSAAVVGASALYVRASLLTPMDLGTTVEAAE